MLHYNENSNKEFVRQRDGTVVLDTEFTRAKYKTGAYSVRRRKEKSTYGNSCVDLGPYTGVTT